MADNQSRPSHSPGGDAGLAFLPSTFSPWRSYEQLSGEGDGDDNEAHRNDDYDLQYLAADVPRPTTPRSRRASLPSSDATLAERDGLHSSQAPLSIAGQEVSPPISPQSSERASPLQAEHPQSQPEKTARLPAAPRASKFREMLSSLSSRRSNRPAYGTVRDLSGDCSYQGQYDEFGGFNRPRADPEENPDDAADDLPSKYCTSSNPPPNTSPLLSTRY